MNETGMPDNSDIYMAIGELKGSLDHLVKDSEYAREQRNAVANAVQSLMALPIRIQKIEEKVDAQSEKLGVLPERVGRLETTVGTHERWRQRGIGMVAILGGGVGAFISNVIEKLRQ
jgi:hypothetical protein